jgi:uncharacterized protein YkwD
LREGRSYFKQGTKLMKKNISGLTAIAFATAAFALAACGGGGNSAASSAAPTSDTSANSGSSSNSNSSTPTVNTGDVSTPQYAANSAQVAVFQLLNQNRQQCGFPALTENTVLDQAAQAHADYLAANNLVSDSEVQGNPGFTGVTYTDRAAHFGYPSSVGAGGVSAGYYSTTTLTETQYGEQMLYAWLSGVYHIGIATWPASQIGVGWNETPYNGYPNVHAVLTLAHIQSITGSLPLTFPCQGTTGVAYSSIGEMPAPPNTSGNWGTPIAVAGNSNDTVVLQTGTITDPTSGAVVNLQVLNAASDPNKELPSYEAVAYPTTPLKPNTTYSVSLTGTYNGAAFSRNFTFTTGNVIG